MPGVLAMFKWNVLSMFSYIYVMLIATKIGFFYKFKPEDLGSSHNMT